MREILSDLVAEQQHLDQFLQGVPDRAWRASTPAEGWTILDQVAHLAYVEVLAAEVLAEGPERMAREGIVDVDEWTARHVAGFRGMRHQEVLERWRFGRADVVEALSHMTAKERIPWVLGDLSAKAFAAMRLMETWAHGLDIKAALLGRITPDPDVEDDPLADTARLRHVVWLAQRSFPYAFRVAGEEYPDAGVRVEVLGPGYELWRYGPAETDQVVKGLAGEFARVAVRRQRAAETGLKAVGEHAETALLVVRCF